MAGKREVSNAIGIERQYTPQVQATYNKRLNNPTFSSGINLGGGNANALRQALGLLGDAVIKEGLAMQTRQEVLGKAEGQRAFNASSDEDKNKLTAVDIIARNGGSDNPFAQATVEQMQGKYIRDSIDSEYQEYSAGLPLAKDSQEEAQRYNDFVNQSLEKRDITIRDNAMFSAGFSEGAPQKFLANDLNFRKRRAEENIYNTTIAASGKLENLLTPDIINAETPEKIESYKNELATVSRELMVTGVPLKTRDKIFNEFFQKAYQYGNRKLIEELANNTIVSHDIDGNPQYLKDRLESYNAMIIGAERNSRFFMSSAMEGLRKEITEMNPKDIKERLINLQNEDPRLFIASEPYQAQWIKTAETAYEAKRREAEKALARQQKIAMRNNIDRTNDESADKAAKAIMDAIAEGKDLYYGGRPINDMVYSAIKYDAQTDSYVREDKKIPDTVFYRHFQWMFQGLLNAAEGSEDMKKAVEKITPYMTFPAFKSYLQTERGNISRLILSAKGSLDDPNTIKKLTQYHNMYLKTPGVASEILGDNTEYFDIMSAITNDLPFDAQQHGEKFKQAIAAVENGKRDPMTQSQVSAFMKDISKGLSIIDEKGDTVTVDRILGGEKIKILATIGASLGTPNIKDYVARELGKQYVGIKTGSVKTAFPRDIADAIAIPNENLRTEAIENFIKQIAGEDEEPNVLINGDTIVVNNRRFTRNGFIQEVFSSWMTKDEENEKLTHETEMLNKMAEEKFDLID